MSTQKDDKWLDELISHSIDTTKPQFDADEWKEKYPNAIRSILSRKTKRATSVQPDILRRIFARPIVGLAAAAVILVLSGFWLTRDKPMLKESAPEEPPNIAQSPIEIVSMMSLRSAYQTGGWDALDRQFRDTLTTLGPRPSSLSMGQLLNGSNGF